VQLNTPRKSGVGAGSDGASEAPQLGRDTSPSQWQSPAPHWHRSRPGVLLPVYVPAIRQIRHSASRDAMHRSRYGTGDHGAAIRRAVASVLASDCLLFRADRGPDATGRIRSGTRGADSCTSEAGHRYRDGSGRTERAIAGTWHHPPRYRTANAPRSCSELASRYQAALSRRIRDSYTIRPVIGSEIGPDCGGHPPRDCGELAP
jgi:hypothetical protein